MTDVLIRPLRPEDHDTWAILFAEYREFCGREPDEEIVRTAWDWLTAPEPEIRGLVAERQGRVVAIAHFRTFLRTVDANRSVHLDDLYVAREARGNGTARHLIMHLGEVAAAEGCQFVRWVTAADNTTARALYEQIADDPGWVTFELTPRPRGTRSAAHRAAMEIGSAS